MTLFGNKKKKLILIIALLAVIIFENANSIENKIELKIINYILNNNFYEL